MVDNSLANKQYFEVIGICVECGWIDQLEEMLKSVNA